MAKKSKQTRIVEATNRYLIANYGRLPVAMVSGKLSRITDADGKEYIDLFAGFGSGGIAGHCHPAIVRAIRRQAGKLLSCGNLFTNEPQVRLAQKITAAGFGGKVFYCHSGAEANEAALKLARLAARKADEAAGRNINNPYGGRYKIISFHNCFHGRTMGGLSLTPEKYQKGFEPMVPGNVKVDYGDLQAVRAAVDDDTAGIFVEPIQGEGGVNMPSRQFMQGLRQLCDQKALTLVCDEVWTAPARTGRWYAHQLYDIQPDVMTLGKATGGGLPVAAMVAAPKVQDVFQPGNHGCTMGGNPLCAAAGLAAYTLVEKEGLLEQALLKGRRITEQLRNANLPCVKDIRGAGLMLGIELDKPGKDAVTACLDRGLLINCTQEKVLRLAPALTIGEDDLAAGLDILTAVLKGV